MSKKLPFHSQSCPPHFTDNFRLQILTILGVFSVTFSVFAQGPGSLFVNAGPDITIACGQNPCTDITANFLQTFETSSSNYNVSSIPYNPPFPFNGLANPLNPDIDDAWSPVDNLPFDFCYFGNIETQFQVGSNGVIRFDVDPGDTSNAWSFSADLPNNTQAALGEANILLPVHDINPATSSTEEIGYEVLGTYPNRVLVVSYYEVPMFSSSCSNLLATQMVVFYEFSNVIEMYIQDKPVCSSWNSGNAALGIQNNDGDIAFVPPGRNTSDSPWTTTNEAWSFTPAGNSTYEFAWLDSSGNVIGTDPTINVCPDSGGSTYTARVIYTNCNGDVVTLTDDVFVDSTATFSVEVGDDQELCDETSRDITAEVINGNPADATFLWNTGQTTQTITVTNSGTYSVDVTIDTCTVTDSVVINFNDRPLIDLGSDVETCYMDPVVLDATPSNYNPADATYEWSLDGVVLAGETDPTLNATQYGVYSVVVAVADCATTDEITISEGNIAVSLGDDFTTCFDTTQTLTAEATNYDPTLATYEWSLDGNVIAGETDQTLDITEAGTYTVTTTFGACTATDSVVVGLGNLDIELGDDFTSCFSEQVVLDGSPSNQNPEDATYEWSMNGTVLAGETNPTLVITEPGTYTVTTTFGSCSTTDSVTVTLGDLDIELGDDFQTCFIEQVSLDASPSNHNPDDATYEWSMDGTVIAGETNPTLEINELGTYSVTVTLGSCTATDSIVVSAGDDLEVSLGADFNTCPNETQTLTATTSVEGVTYQWFLNGAMISGETDSTLDFTVEAGSFGTQTYSVVITTASCTGTDSVDIMLYPVGNCTISQGISPNGDGYNDSLDLTFLNDRAGVKKLQIFNRMGTLVFEQNNYTNQWSGQDKNSNELTTGTYFYVIDLAGNDAVYGTQATGWIYLNREAN